MGFIYFPHGAIMDNTLGRRTWTPDRRGLRADADPQAARAVPEAPDHRQRARQQAGRERRRCTRSCRAPGCRACSRAISHEPHGGVTVDQIAAAAHRPGHAAAVARGRDGGAGRRRRVRPQLRLQLRQHDLVPHADDAAADGAQSAQAVPAALRPGRHARRSARRIAKRHASMLDMVHGGGGGPRERTLGPQRPRDARRLSRQRARDRAARAEDGGSRTCPAWSCPTCPVGIPSTSTST